MQQQLGDFEIRLNIIGFYGTSENAVKSQIWIAESVYVLVAIVKKRLNLDASLYTLLGFFRSPCSRKCQSSKPLREVLLSKNRTKATTN